MIRKPNFRLNWKYALGELALIFLGISLAVAFQNWNQNRLENREANTALQNITEGLRTVSQELDIFIQKEKNHLNLLVLFSSASKIDSLANELSFDSLTYDVTYSYGNTVLSFPVYESLKASGKIELIKDPIIRSQLDLLDGKFKAMIDDLLERQSSQLMHVDPILLKYFDVPRLRNASQDKIEIISYDIDHRKVLKKVEVQNALTYKLAFAQNITNDLGLMKILCDEILIILDKRQ